MARQLMPASEQVLLSVADTPGDASGVLVVIILLFLLLGLKSWVSLLITPLYTPPPPSITIMELPDPSDVLTIGGNLGAGVNPKP